jgi:hypothetical protein
MNSNKYELFHYTSPEAAKNIVQTGVINGGQNGRVYVTDVKMNPAVVASQLIFQRTGDKGEAFVRLEANDGAVNNLDPGLSHLELINRGSIRDGRNGFKILGWRMNK